MAGTQKPFDATPYEEAARRGAMAQVPFDERCPSTHPKHGRCWKVRGHAETGLTPTVRMHQGVNGKTWKH